MKITDKVRVKQTKRTGTIVDTQKSSLGRMIFIVKFHEYYTEGFFEDELEIVDITQTDLTKGER